MIMGAHAITTSTDPEADRALLRDAPAVSHVEGGTGRGVYQPCHPRPPAGRSVGSA